MAQHINYLIVGELNVQLLTLDKNRLISLILRDILHITTALIIDQTYLSLGWSSMYIYVYHLRNW